MSESEDLLSQLKNLKDKLDNMEVDYDEKLQTIEKRNRTHETLEKKLTTLVNCQASRIKVEAGGRVYETTKDNIKSCIYPNLLKDQLDQEEDVNSFKTVYYVNGQPVEKETIYFVDIDKKNFKLILRMLRFFFFSDYKEKFPIIITEKMDEEYIKQEIKYFFKGNDDVFKMIEFKSQGGATIFR